LQLVHLLEGLVFAHEMDGLGPLVQTQVHVAELRVYAALEVNVLTVKLSKLDIEYSFTCSVKPFSSPSKLTIVFFYFSRMIRACFRKDSANSRIARNLDRFSFCSGGSVALEFSSF
jgi:hypothetical protein